MMRTDDGKDQARAEDSQYVPQQATASENEAIRAELRDMYAQGRSVWYRDTAEATRQIDRFAQALGRALGEISRDEAIDALKRQAAEEIERLR